MPFNCCEFTVVYLEWLSFRTASTALTSLGDVPVPLNRRIGETSFDAGGAQAVRASEAMHKINWTFRFFTRCEQFLTTPATAATKRVDYNRSAMPPFAGTPGLGVIERPPAWPSPAPPSGADPRRADAH